MTGTVLRAADSAKERGSLYRPAVWGRINKLIATGVFLWAAAAPGTAPAAARIISAQVAQADTYARIVLESDNPIRFALLSLRNPERLVLDLEDVEFDPVVRSLALQVDADHPYLMPLRVSRMVAGGVRVELDLKTDAAPRISTLKPDGRHGYRIVLEIHPEHGQRLAREDFLPPPEPAPAPDAAQAPAGEAAEAEEVLLEVRVNRQAAAQTALLLRRRDGRLLARAEDLQQWRLRLPDVAAQSHRGEDYYPLDALRGLSYQMDEPNQALHLDAAPGLFGATELKGTAAGFTTPAPAPPGGFFNYDLFAVRSQAQTVTSGLFELGAFGGWGAGIGSFLGQDLGGENRIVRLETTWTHDRPAELATLRVGDSITGAGSWGRSVRFGGVRWATNFATQPGFITFPLPGLSGEAAVPSTVDLYLNDSLRLRRQVPSGPFSIQDLPVITGQGEARLVVRDLLGREQVIVQPYYASPRLLQQGLHDYSYELGFVREDFGIASNRYGRPLAVGTHRRGFSDRFTGEAHGELLEDQQTAGVGGALLWSDVGLLSAAVAGSRQGQGSGALLALGFERLTRGVSFGGNIQVASERFTQLGLQPGQPAPRRSSRVFASLPTAGYGALGLAYTHQSFREQDDVELLSASYSFTIGRLGYLSVSLLRFLSGEQEQALSLSFTMPLGNRTSASTSVTAKPGSQQALVQVQRSLPAGSGVGYRLLAGAGDTARREAGASAQSDIGTYSLDVSQFQGQTAVRGSASGGVAVLGGSAHLTRRITDSFAVVQVPDHPDVRVYADNQPVARTGRDGSALLPRLRPYETNQIRIEQADLPLDAQIDAVQVDAVPYFRSGLLLKFPVTRSRGALLTVTLEDGGPLPAGAVGKIIGNPEEFPAGLRGEIYLTGLAASNRLIVNWRDQTCELALTFPDTDDPLPHLGVHVCNGVKR